MISYNVKTIRAVELKETPLHVERANLDFDISHLIIRAILSELLKFKVELPCFKMSKISIKRHIKLKFSLLVDCFYSS